MKRGEREYSSTFNRLTVDGFVPEQNLQFRSKVAVCEKGKRYALATAEGQDSVVYAVDGYIVKDGLRCDKLVLVRRTQVLYYYIYYFVRCDKLVLVRRTQEGRIPENWSVIFVELKGTDIEHAIAQLRATLSKPLFRHPANDDIRARIVAQSFPAHKSDLKMEKAKKEFRQNYDCDLRGMKTGQEEKL